MGGVGFEADALSGCPVADFVLKSVDRWVSRVSDDLVESISCETKTPKIKSVSANTKFIR